jgi:hypothetical protein
MTLTAEEQFVGPYHKLKRARDHLIDLEQYERSFFETNRPTIVIETDPMTGHQIAKVKLTVKPPEIIHVLVAEIIYHLRSSLDQIAVALGRLSASKPNVKKTYFPTGDRFKAFRADRMKKLAGVDKDLVLLVVKLKPYGGGNDLLRSVFPLANEDKHLELIAMAASGQITGIQGYTFVNASIALDEGPRALHDDITFAQFYAPGGIIPNDDNSQVKVNGRITFGNVAGLHGIPVISRLEELTQLIEKVLEVFVTHCRTTGRVS